MKKLVPALLSLVLVLFFSLPSSAQPDALDEPAAQAGMDKGGMMPGKCGPGCMCEKCMKGGMMGMSGDIDRMTWPPMNKSCRTPEFYLTNREALGLSGYQIDALKKLHTALKKDMILKGANVKVLELELSEIVTKPDFKLDDALAKLKDIEKARVELRTAVLKSSSDARDVLSPEQMEKLKGMELPAFEKHAPPSGQPGEEMKQKMMEKMREEMMQ